MIEDSLSKSLKFLLHSKNMLFRNEIIFIERGIIFIKRGTWDLHFRYVCRKGKKEAKKQQEKEAK